MASAAPAAAHAAAPATGVITFDLTQINIFVWKTTRAIHRIYPDHYAANAFNPTTESNARFSTLFDQTGAVIPTLYGGTTFECAAMETVFHDVPYAPGLKTYAKKKLVDKAYSMLYPARDLQLLDLTTKSLRKLGIQKTTLIETDATAYATTRKFAELVHLRCPNIDGLHWISRQDDQAEAIVLFGDRVAAKDLVPHGTTATIIADVALYAALLDLAGAIGVAIVNPAF